jgi:predicted metal-dependent peptidase
MAETRIALMNAMPFLAFYFYDQLKEYPTYDMPTAAIDGRRLFYNPKYFQTLSVPERCFAFGHECDHGICRHPERMSFYQKVGNIRGRPFDAKLFNVCADFIINARLVKSGCGVINGSWLFDPAITGDELVEDIYCRKYDELSQTPQQPQGQPGPGQPGPGQPGPGQPGPGGKPQDDGGVPSGTQFPKAGDGKKGQLRDKIAEQFGGRFDQLAEPVIDPITGEADLPTESEFKEAIQRAAQAAKAMGKQPLAYKGLIDDILDAQVTWQDHLRMTIGGKIGRRQETWDKLDRHSLVMHTIVQERLEQRLEAGERGLYNPILIKAGRKGYGADTVVCAIDCSGSVGDDEIQAYMSEMGGILTDVKPRKVILLWVDAIVQRVDEARFFDDLVNIRHRGRPGRGGTRFSPAFDWVKENNVRPDTLVYLTDMEGTFPEEPSYPVVWCATRSKINAPFGETIHIKMPKD